MPDLLNISKETVLAALEHELQEAHKQLDWKAERLRKDVSEAVEALPHVEKPLEGAEVVASINFPLNWDMKSGGQISLNIGGQHEYINIQSEIRKGKYRVFLFMHRVGDID